MELGKKEIWREVAVNGSINMNYINMKFSKNMNII